MDSNALPNSEIANDLSTDVNVGRHNDVTVNAAEPKKPRKEKSIYKGVFRCGSKFKAQIQTNGVQHYLGLFNEEKDAARAYDNHARVSNIRIIVTLTIFQLVCSNS
jgi:hypothetical protein